MIRSTLQDLFKEGTQYLSGVDEAVLRNIEAAKQLSNITRTSLGPNGMNKMVIDHLEKLFVTHDAATIMQELEVVHPAAKLIVMASQAQEKEVGDGTNFVVVFAGELLAQAEALLSMGLHPSDILEGYTKALKKTLEVLESLARYDIKDVKNRPEVRNLLKSVISSKQFGFEDKLADLVTDACIEVCRKPQNFNIDNVRVVKVEGGSVSDSKLVRGFVIPRDSQGTIKRVEKAKVAVFGCSLEPSQSETKGSVLITSAEELKNYNKSEDELMEKIIKEIAESGVNVVVSSGGINDLALHYIEKYKMMAVKILSKFDLRRLCRAIDAVSLTRVGAPTPEEVGECDLVVAEEIAGRMLTVFRKDVVKTKVATVLVRGATENLMNDVERAIDDAVNAYKTACKDGRLMIGAGASDIELSRLIQEHANECPGLDQYAVRKFGESFEAVPRVLAENCGLNSTETLASLYAEHKKGNIGVGVNVEDGVIEDMTDRVFDLFLTKHTAIRLATDAALDVLRVDKIIHSKPAGGPKGRPMGPADQD